MGNQLSTQLTPEVLMAAIVGFVVGGIIFWLLGKSRSHPDSVHNPLQKPYKELKAEYKAYREKVNQHFSKTATAVDNLTKSYQEVFTHLSTGAETLMDSEALKLAREKRQGKSVTLAYLTDIKAQPASTKSATRTQTTAETTNKLAEETTTLTNHQHSEKTTAEEKSNALKAAEKAGLKPVERPVNTNETLKAKAAGAPVEKPSATQVEKSVEKPENTNETLKTKVAGAPAEKGVKAEENDPLNAVKRHIKENK